MINDILDINKIESGNMQFDITEFEISELIAQVITDNNSYASQHEIKLEYIKQEKAIIKSDANRLTQVLNNLLSNAAKFSPDGSVVSIKSEVIENNVRISVSDKGPGIEKDFQSMIFEKFTQADSDNSRRVGGTGLGLNISKAILNKLGGHISFETQMGKGTIFYVDLPMV